MKTSPGFSSGGAGEEHARLMHETAGPDVNVKASGAVRDRHTAEIMIQAGACRIGTRSGVTIVQGTSGEGY